MFQFWGDGSQLSKELVNQIVVRSTDNFNWTFIFILAVVFYVYWSELNKKNYDAVFAGLALYGVHWQPIDYIHSFDRCVLGAFHDVFPGRYNLFQNAAKRQINAIFC